MVVNLIIENQIKCLGHFEFSKSNSNTFLHLTMSRNVNYTIASLGNEETISFEVLYVRLHNDTTRVC